VDAVFVARAWALEAPIEALRTEMAHAHAAASRSAGA
jgi:hypothetical protein